MKIAVHAALLRSQDRLLDRLDRLDARVASGEEEAWPAYCDAVRALAAIAPLSTPEVRGQLLTTRELADRLQLSPRTIRRKVKDGTLQPRRFGRRGRGALRWPQAETR